MLKFRVTKTAKDTILGKKRAVKKRATPRDKRVKRKGGSLVVEHLYNAELQDIRRQPACHEIRKW
jgi:hypothetical protein